MSPAASTNGSDGTRRPVGLIGLGRMGLPMAQALLRAGFSVVGSDVDAAARDRAARSGSVAVETSAEVVRVADPVILMLPSSAVVEAVVHDPEFMQALRPGLLLIDMGSSEPMRTRRLAAELAQRWVRLVDAPVSGGVRRAETGTLTIMAGGDKSDVAAARPVLESMGTVTHVGPAGSGHAVKALNNLLSATHLVATAEVMYAGELFGLDPEVMLSVFNTSSGRSGSTELKWPDYVLTGRYDSGFALALMLKDVRIAVDLARNVGAPELVASSVAAAWAQAAEALPPEADHTEIARWVFGAAPEGRDRTPNCDETA